ncbi:hypothetical protein [Gimesia sp.]|uniref:hypothetical protein n=1 Tax=Gimesia sp. TaxID=2024833 RepID=UPI003A908261
MKKLIQMQLSFFVLMLFMITFEGCSKSNQAVKENSTTGETPAEVSSPEVSNPVNEEALKGPAEMASNSKPEIQSPVVNEQLNISGTVYKTNKSLVIITDAKSKTIPDIEGIPLNITVRVSNQDQANLNYTSWTPVGPGLNPDSKKAHVEDDKGNIYPIIPVSNKQTLEGQVLQADLKPGGAVKDLLLFSELKPETKRIKLYLPGSAFTDNKDLIFHFQLP